MRFWRELVKKLGLYSVAVPVYRSLRRLQYRLAGDTLTVEVADAQADFLIPTQNEWTDLETIDERPILNHLLSNVRRDDVFYDVGANIGLYSCLVADVVDRPVVAFEPHPPNADRLEDNVELNEADVSVFRHALADSAGSDELTITLDEVGSAGHSLVTDPSDGLDSVTIPTKRGDDLVREEGLPRPTILKIDVEGAETAVLDGLETTLSAPGCRLVYCETHSNRLAAEGCSVADIRDRLTSYGFSVSTRSVRRGKGESFLIGRKPASSG